MCKRLFDIIGSSIMIVLLSPVLAFLYYKVRQNLGSPVMFCQERPGLNGNIFKMYKFRSMRDAVDMNGEQLPDEERLTAFGKKLRASSLDELPELFNILKGEMSFVGPRPLLVEYLPLYNNEQARRHDVKPGITGWAQVNGRNTISWDEKFKLDVWYVDNRSFLLDVKILFLTVFKVISKSDINQSKDITMEKFTGKNQSVVEDRYEE